jgi:hypothetical protein
VKKWKEVVREGVDFIVLIECANYTGIEVHRRILDNDEAISGFCNVGLMPRTHISCKVGIVNRHEWTK